MALRLPRRAGLTLAALAVAGMALWLWPSLPALQSDLGLLHDVIERGKGWRTDNSGLAVLAFFTVFAFCAALPLPIVVGLTLAGGAFFGFWLGIALSLAGTLAAAMLTFLAARHLLTRRLRRALGTRVRQLDEMVARDGALALFSLRLAPGLPFFVLNLLSGLSILPVRPFLLVTALGVMPNKVILTAAGTQLAEIDQISDIVGPRVIAIVAVLAIFPWIARWIARRLRATNA
ncbi:MAG: TVP38/TMEM64 family protein [Alphaproteobacteria bacterium]|nr:TVP38/TMEM64 family protein [Alphaproteobacteria bacterium]